MTISKKALLFIMMISFLAGCGFSTWAGWGIMKDIENSKMAIGNYVLEHGELPPDSMVVAVPESNQVVVLQPNESPKLVALPTGVAAGTKPEPAPQSAADDGFRPVTVQ